jgi:transketolase
MGMSEQNMIGVASGLAKTGLLPIVVTYGVFITRRAYDQVAMSLATGPTRSVLVGFMPGITSAFRASHQAIDDMALMRAVPGMTVVDPGDGADLAGALLEAPAQGGPVYVRAFRGEQPPLPRTGPPKPIIGSASELAAEGSVAFVSSGLATQWAVEAAAVLRRDGIDAAILHVPCVKPLDAAAVTGFCARHRRVICVENHSTIGGLNDAVARTVAAAGLGTTIVSAGIPDAWPESGSVSYLRERLGLTGEALARLASEPGR